MPTSTDNPYFEIRRSPIQGRGAFALRKIRKGTRIIEYTGERISHDEGDRRYDDEKMKRHHTFLFTLDSKMVVDGGVHGNVSRFINHSCDPNCEAVIEKRRIWIEALRTIHAGEELAYDYQYEREDEDDEEADGRYPCRCGAASCRGTILVPRKRRRRKPAAGKTGAKQRTRKR